MLMNSFKDFLNIIYSKSTASINKDDFADYEILQLERKALKNTNELLRQMLESMAAALMKKFPNMKRLRVAFRLQSLESCTFSKDDTAGFPSSSYDSTNIPFESNIDLLRKNVSPSRRGNLTSEH
ncbi:hypothetical protein Adt_44304 [Abeliophyllum distichum]|uniref:Uncharacterized protein n=1 Tax=Abeliophyllum distichum TaxID=126358 RepID=A0ABD1PCR2_9LAMI